MMLIAVIALALVPLHASPAKAGAQSRPLRSWAPAFAGEALLLDVDKDTSSGSSSSTPSEAMSPIDAERAFAADAKTIGQWTAFRKWSTEDGVMFVPQPTNAHEFLKDRKDPLKVIDWWPTTSWISCDGSLAVNTGGWTRPDGSVGYFSTVWQRQADGGWKWIVDGGDGLNKARARLKRPVVKVARCLAPGRTLDSLMAFKSGVGGQGQSKDGTLFWWWSVAADGSRTFHVDLYNGNRIVPVLNDRIAAPPK